MRERSLHERANMISSAEERKAIEIAKNLLDVLDDEIIAAKTGLDIEEVKSLRVKNPQDNFKNNLKIKKYNEHIYFKYY